MDLLVTFEDSNPIVQSPVDMYVYWNNKGTFPSSKSRSTFSCSLVLFQINCKEEQIDHYAKDS